MSPLPLPWKNESANQIKHCDADCDPDAPAAFQPRLELVSLADVTPHPVRWLWPGRIPLGKLSIIAGSPGVGKSFLTMDMAARVSSGTAWHDCPNEINLAGKVVIMSAEDDAADTIHPRIASAQGDFANIEIVKGAKLEAGESSAMFKIDRDLSLLDQAIEQTQARLCIIDPLNAFMGKVDTHKDAEIRGILAPLSDLAARNNCAVVVVSHLNKRVGGNAIDRLQGSVGLVGAARVAWLVVKDPSDTDRRLMVNVKSNICKEASGIAYRIDDDGVHWLAGAVRQTANELLAEVSSASKERDEAAKWLTERLADGPVPAKEIKEEVKGAGDFTMATVRRAKRRLRIVSRKEGFDDGAHWVWALPDGEDARQRTCAPSANDSNLRGFEDGVSAFGFQGHHSEGDEGAQVPTRGESAPLRGQDAGATGAKGDAVPNVEGDHNLDPFS